MTLVGCPTCFGQCSFLCACQGAGCELCEGEGTRACDTCGRFGQVEEPLHCPSCGRHHGGDLRGWGLDEMHELRRVQCGSCERFPGPPSGPRAPTMGDLYPDPRGVPAVPNPSISEESGAGSTTSEATAPGSTPDRIDSVRRRWDSDNKPCGRCGAPVLWRHEGGRRVPLNENATEHGCA